MINWLFKLSWNLGYLNKNDLLDDEWKVLSFNDLDQNVIQFNIFN